MESIRKPFIVRWDTIRNPFGRQLETIRKPFGHSVSDEKNVSEEDKLWLAKALRLVA